MPTKIRKQIYLEKRQNQKLRRLAEARGVSEAEVIRELIDAQTSYTPNPELPPDRAAWESILAFARKRAAGQPYKWNRQELYDEREERLARRLNEPKPSSARPDDTLPTGKPG